MWESAEASYVGDWLQRQRAEQWVSIHS